MALRPPLARPAPRGRRLRVFNGAPCSLVCAGLAHDAASARAAKSPEAAPPAWPPPKPAERRRAGEPLLWGTGLRKSHDGERVQFAGLDLTLERGTKTAVVGPNGCGKSTLLRALAGLDRELDAGDVQLRKGTRLAALAQEPVFAPDTPVLSAVLQGDAPVLALLARYRSTLARATAGDAAAAAELAALTPQMDAAGAWGVEAEVRIVLQQLGCEGLLERTMGQLSGGQAKRVALATALIQSPDVLILDEPTNHLSVGGVEWLAERLADPALTVLMVSHDRAFVDAVCTDVLELDGSGGVFRHAGGYQRFLLGREERMHAIQAAADNAATVLRREEAWMAKQPRARQAKSQSRQDAFYRLQEAAEKTPQRMGTIDLEDGVRASRLGDVTVELRDVSLSFGSKRILNGFTHAFGRRERVGLVGDNGAGKTTFLNICRGLQQVDSGSVIIGETVRFGHYTQHVQIENPEMRVADYVQQLAAEAREDDADGRDWNGWTVTELLKRFQFMKGRQATPIGDLSGGEKRRLQLLTVLSRRPNVLFLDEATNDLDLETIEQLEAVLQGFDGVVVMTGHDRVFLDTLAQHIFVFEGNGVVSDWQGSYSELRAHQKAREAEAAAAAARPSVEPAPRAAVADAAASREARRLATNAKNKMPQVEAALEKVEAEIAALDQALVDACADAGKAAELATKRDAAVARQEQLYAEYERLDALVLAGGGE